MPINPLLSFIALAALLPSVAQGLRREPRRDVWFWLAAGLAVAGPAAEGIFLVGGQWVTGFAPALWISVAAMAGLFMLVAASMAEAWRLMPLLAPYLIALAILGTVWQQATGAPVHQDAPDAWLPVHIAIGVGTYALLTLAAVAALAAVVQERALKAKQPTRLSRQMPPVAVAEALSTRLLTWSEMVLGLGLITGMAVEWFEHGAILMLDHKTLLSFLAFALIGALLIGKRTCGVRGRVATRVLLVAYLLLTLAYPGVKFVSGVMLG